jgi:heat-inducible transcriptional repressor
MMELTERQKLVLALVIKEYVDSADPVSSGRLVENYRLDFSSATVRNEMAALSDQGYLLQPYTSAGRVPTKQGYRYFVQQLMGPAELPPHIQQMIRHQFYQARHDVDDWLSLSASILARHTEGASIVTALHTEQARVKHLALLATRGRQVLLVMVLESGEVIQQTLVFEDQVPQDHLSQLAGGLNQLTSGRDARALRRLRGEAEDKLTAKVLEVMAEEVERAGTVTSGEVYRDGLTNVLAQPEFSEPDLAQKTLRVLEDRAVLNDMLSRTVFESDSPGVHVIIGGEDSWEELQDCSVVLAQYGSQDHSLGAVGVIGPMRMAYNRAVSTVQFVSDLMSELVSESLGG